MRAVLLVATINVVAACTFPDVDYADGGASTGGGGSTSTTMTSTSSSGTTACFVPSACETQAMTCAKGVNDDHQSCVKQCNSNQMCIVGCDKTMQTALGQCSAACDNCTMCKPNNCRDLVGL